MGTRADFYIKKANNELEWLGSIAWDGNEIDDVADSRSAAQYKRRLKKFLDGRDDSTYPNDGWPWPWNNSKLTDCTYVFADGEVYKCYQKIGAYEDITTPLLFCPYEFDPYNSEGEPKKRIVGKRQFFMPDMAHLKNVRMDKGSGLIVISAR